MTLEEQIAAHVAMTKAQATHHAIDNFWGFPTPPVEAVGNLPPLPAPIVTPVSKPPVDYLVKQRRIRTRKVIP